jgi:ATP-dependent protease Clp ATPase subunit
VGLGRKPSEDALRCSFCHKSQDVVGKLISSPSDYPRAYICDECVMVCYSILQDDKGATAPPHEPHHPVYGLLEQLRPEELDALTYLIEVMLRRVSRNTPHSG